MQPVIIQDAISIAANSVNENVIVSNNSLRALQRLPFPAAISIAAVQSAAGLSFDFFVAGKNLVASSNGRVSASTPLIPLDVINGNMYAAEGSMLTLRVSNTTGGALTIRYKIVATPLADQGQLVQLPPDSLVMQQGPIVVANGTVDQQLLNGLRFERAPSDSLLDVLATASATGMTMGTFVEMERVQPNSTLSLENRIPQDPFDQVVGNIEVPDDSQIQLQLTNQSGGNLNVFWKTVLTELVRQ